MYKKIEVNNKIFESEDFQKDKYLFNIFLKKVNNPDANIMSDEENYIITNESPETAPWIWSKDNIDKSLLNEIKELFKLYLVKDEMNFTCKKELYHMLVDSGFELIPAQEPFEIGFMKCDTLKETKPNDGWIDRVKSEEKELIAKYILNFERAMDASVSDYNKKTEAEVWEECLSRADEEVNSDKFYVLRNKDGKIVSMAHYSLRENNTAKVGLVYTPDEERGHGYAAKLVREITKMLLDGGYIPVLYTDYNYPNSNKAYANAGYVSGGTLVNFVVRKG
jgi:predicted GNAT family acetyltransferase